jgi:hypothetical protein
MGDRKAAIEFYNEAVKTVQDRSQPSFLSHAYGLFSSACMVDPTFGTGWYQAGNNNSDLDRLYAAVACWRRGLQEDLPKDDIPKALVNLGWRLHGLGRTDEALRVTREALTIDPELALGWNTLSLIQNILGDSVGSVSSAREAHRLDPNDLNCEMALGFALLFDGQYQEGYKHFEKRFEWRLHNYLHYPYSRWTGEDLSDKTLFLSADQGMGDTLSYARFVERAAKKCGFIHASVQSELMRLFQYAFAHLPNVNLIPIPSPLPAADYWTTFVSLPFALGLTADEVRDTPHIKVTRFTSMTSWLVPDRKFHIGIAWAGSPLNDINKHRNIPLQHFLELYRVPGVQLYGLQVDDRAKDLENMGTAALIRDLKPYIRDVTDTLGILPQLDLVITCESALGHICALADKECWIPYSWLGRDYRLGCSGEQMLWTPKHRIFRQGSDMQWEPVFEQIVTALKEKVR